MNGYSLFSQECMRDAEMMKGVENKQRMGLVASKWKTLAGEWGFIKIALLSLSKLIG